MDCNKFQDSISDYLDCSLDARNRAECAAHRLICRGCRELYNDVRAAMQALSTVAQRPLAEPPGLEHRIIAATSAGEMLSCGDFDRLIERYFDGVILAPTFQTFQAHFEKCLKCRRLMGGIEEAIATCREIKETEIEMPESLHDRIVAATVGVTRSGNWYRRRRDAIALFLSGQVRPLWTAQMAVAALIFAASSLLILSRFGSVKGMATQAGVRAESLFNHGQRAISNTSAMARTGFQRVSFLFDEGAAQPDPIKPPPSLNGSEDKPPLPQKPEPTPTTERDGKENKR
jgi:predicted anti-sigma-YlaC factor YlaD